MPKDKKSKRKRREQDEILDEDSSSDGESEDGALSLGAWNTDDLYFDRNGRLVVKNTALASAIARAVSEQGGIVVHIAYPDDGGRAALINPKTPPPPLPWPNYTCPDMICGLDLNFVVSKKPMRDPPRDRGWERGIDR